jgi:hypothetical protein
MMRYLLDANVVIGLLNDATSKLAYRARRERPADIAISAIVAHEAFLWRVQEPTSGAKSGRGRFPPVCGARARQGGRPAIRRDPCSPGFQGTTRRPLRRADCWTGQGAQLDPRHTQHGRIRTRARIAFRRLARVTFADAQRYAGPMADQTAQTAISPTAAPRRAAGTARCYHASAGRPG